MRAPLFVGIFSLLSSCSGRSSLLPEAVDEAIEDRELLAAIDGNCGNNRNPIPNLESALRGYNVVQGNQFFQNGNDPGFKNTIFKGSFIDQDAGDDERCIYNNIKQYEATFCKKSGNSRSYRSYKDYQEAKSGSVSNSASVSASLSVGANLPFGLSSFISSFEATSSFMSSSTSEFSKERKFFSESKGEIYMNKAQCEVFEVRISNNLKPTFTEDFIIALKNLENAAKTPESSTSKKAMKDFFTRDFGTHYMSSVFMGASMTTENRYVGTTSSSEMRSMRKQCSDNSYRMSVGVGTSGADVSTEFETAAEKCKGDESSNAFFSENSYNEFNVVTRGSIPTVDEDEWRSNIKESPIPIRFELTPISDLIRADWVSEHGLDAALLRDFVTDSLRSYCEVVLGRACVPVKGCGVTGFCGDTEVCSPNFMNQTHGFRCDSCGYGWEFNTDNEKCYKYVSDEKTWWDCQRYCIARAPNPFGDLAAAPDQRTNDFISSMNGKRAYLGGYTEYEGSRDWIWSDGSKWEYTSWEKNQPDNAGGTEQRVETNFRDVFGKWNDGDGNNKRAFFCQYTLKGCYLEFEVRGKSDAHIVFAGCKDCEGYKVVIGGWGNTKSRIRDSTDAADTGQDADTPGIMSEQEFRKFWVRVGEGNANSISVGRGGEDEPFMTRTLSKTHAVFYTAFNTYKDNTIYWRIKQRDEVKEITTKGSESYKYLKYHCYNK